MARMGILYGGGDGYRVRHTWRSAFTASGRLLLPGVQPAVRSLLRGNRRHQAGDEQRQVDSGSAIGYQCGFAYVISLIDLQHRA